MLVVVNQPHTEGFRIEGRIPKDVLDYVESRYSKENISVINDDGEELLDPHDMNFYKEVKASQTPGGNLRFYRRLVRMTQPELASELGTSKQAISLMENNKRPISRKTAKELGRIFQVSPKRFFGL